jgi:hypothetical protein
MRLLVSAALAAACAFAQPKAPNPFFQVEGPDAGGWAELLSSVGFHPAPPGAVAGIVVLRSGAGGPAEAWLARVDAGAFLVLEGQSAAATALGFRATARRVEVRSAEDLRRPRLSIVWERAVDLPVFETPEAARVFARERRGGAPLMAGFRRGAGAVLWVAAPPGAHGYERFPYLPQALADLGIRPPFQSRRLWAFFDSSYRLRADVNYLAPRWREAGIAALHVAAWQYFEPDPQRDRYLRELIVACHRNAILVYAWLELPHVSEKFWNDHPGWREKTALLQDAQLDWRKLMNLANRDCFRAVSTGVRALAGRFDWDGVNIAELYFESLEGAANPSRFTPMNDDVRREFRSAHGFDPIELFAADGERKHPGGLRQFLDYRASLAGRIETEWIEEIEDVRRGRPELDLVLTHVDDRFDANMRDAIGADAGRSLPLLDRHDFTFLVEDPATVWAMGPQRYPEIARRYQPLTKRAEKLAIDINVVERYQDVYPTKQQTGVELFQLVNLASRSFARVALYFESSILAPDLPLLAAASAAVTRVARTGDRLAVESPRGAGVEWNAPALVDGRPWPAGDGSLVWLPPGSHVIEAAPDAPPLRLLDLNGDLAGVAATRGGIEIAYRSSARAIAILNRRPVRLDVDGAEAPVAAVEAGRGAWALMLPRGQHIVNIAAE